MLRPQLSRFHTYKHCIFNKTLIVHGYHYVTHIFIRSFRIQKKHRVHESEVCNSNSAQLKSASKLFHLAFVAEKNENNYRVNKMDSIFERFPNKEILNQPIEQTLCSLVYKFLVSFVSSSFNLKQEINPYNVSDSFVQKIVDTFQHHIV